jgi:predicted secreted hydrolase
MKKPKPIVLPNDMHPHKEIVEWWYYNGHLQDTKGNRYAFMNCLFKVDIRKVNIPYLRIPFKKQNIISDIYFAHSVLSDITHGKNWKEIQNISLLSRDSFKRPLFYANYADPIITRGYMNSEIAETKPGTFHIKTELMDLWMESKKTPLLEGGKGYISAGNRGSYYYSLTRLETRGKIYVDKKWIDVTGLSWMDHQWANVPYSKDKWTWFSVQLENGTDIMCVEYDNRKWIDCLADIIHENGRMEHYKKLELYPGKKAWKSSATGSVYPLSWSIKIPEADISLEVASLTKNQEMIFRAINYWEGPLQVTATIGGKKVKGQGFMELVGYDASYNAFALAGKEMTDNLKRQLKQQIKKVL